MSTQLQTSFSIKKRQTGLYNAYSVVRSCSFGILFIALLEAVERILRLNKDSENEDEDETSPIVETWKVLILDPFCKRIVAPLLDTKHLKQLGITLTFDIAANRNPIYGVPAIYFVRPEADTIQRICNVCPNIEHLTSNHEVSFF